MSVEANQQHNLWHLFNAVDNLLEPVKAHGPGRFDIQYQGCFVPFLENQYAYVPPDNY